MESNKAVTPIQQRMADANVTVRDLAGITGESTALVSYVSRGLAHFPTYAQLERCCERMGCKPQDMYTKAQLRMMYPEQFPKRKRTKDGNPRVRIRDDVFAYFSNKAEGCGCDVGSLINAALAGFVTHDRQGHIVRRSQ